MATLEYEAEGLRMDRRAHWYLTAGGAIVLMEGLFLGLFGIYILGAYLNHPNDILIPLGVIALSGSVLSLIGADAIFKHRKYALAVVGSAIPATAFLGSLVILTAGGEPGFWRLLLPLGLLGISGVILVTASRKVFPLD